MHKKMEQNVLIYPVFATNLCFVLLLQEPWISEPKGTDRFLARLLFLPLLRRKQDLLYWQQLS